MTKRHHGLGPGAVPARREAFLEEDYTDAHVVIDTGRLQIRDLQPGSGDRRIRSTEGVYYLARVETGICGGFYLLDTGAKVRCRKDTAGSVLNLHDKDGINRCCVLDPAVVRPVVTLIPPLLGACLKDGHLAVHLVVVRVLEDDAVLEKTGFNDVSRIHVYAVKSRERVAQECIEAVNGGRHPDDDGHRRNLITTLDKFLHYRRGPAGLFSLGPPVRFVNNDYEVFTFPLCGVPDSLPDSVGTGVGH